MDEMKFVSLFPELNKNNINKIQNKTIINNYKDKKSLPINILLFKNDFNSSNERLETEFLKNKIKFFSHNITPNKQKNFRNKTDFKYPVINKKKKTKKILSKTVNIKNIPLYKESKPIIYRIFDKLDEVNKKYKEQTKYYNHFIKNEDNHRKFNINSTNTNLRNLKSYLLNKNNSKKYCSYVYRRIKKIEL